MANYKIKAAVEVSFNYTVGENPEVLSFWTEVECWLPSTNTQAEADAKAAFEQDAILTTNGWTLAE